MAQLRQVVGSGLIVVAPITVTLIAVGALVRRIARLSIVAGIEPAYLRAPTVIVVFILTVFGAGYLMRTAIGTVLERQVTELINRVPLLRVVYNASQLAIETVVSSEYDRAEPVRIETWDGMQMTAFTTGNRAPDGRLICFLPTAPNVTTGWVIEVDESEVVFTGERIERALTRLLSAGFGENDRDRQGDVPLSDQVHRIDRVE